MQWNLTFVIAIIPVAGGNLSAWIRPFASAVSIQSAGACLQAISPLQSSFAEATEDGSWAPIRRSFMRRWKLAPTVGMDPPAAADGRATNKSCGRRSSLVPAARPCADSDLRPPSGD